MEKILKKECINQIPSLTKDFLKEIVTSKILTGFEPEEESIMNVTIGKARFISGKLMRSADDSFIKCEDSYYNFNTVLVGIYMFLKKDFLKEYLSTVFGKHIGKKKQVLGLHISCGTEHNVNFSSICFDYFQKHIKIDKAWVMICHNHPKCFFNNLIYKIIGNSPLPSNIDRKTMLQLKYGDIFQWLFRNKPNDIRFFLVENSRLKEFKLPPFDKIVYLINSIK